MWIDRVVKWLLPREEHFFDMLEKSAGLAKEIGSLLAECCEAPSEDREALVERMREVEHRADRVIAEVYEALNRTFVTPLDRSDIYELASSLERIVDDVFATALQIVVHDMEDLPPGSCELAALIHEACGAVETAVADLRGMTHLGRIREPVRTPGAAGERGGPDLSHAACVDVPDRNRRHPSDQAQGVPGGPGGYARYLRRRGWCPPDHRDQERVRAADEHRLADLHPGRRRPPWHSIISMVSTMRPMPWRRS